MRSLRARLVAILVLVALTGLVLLAAATYAAQRSYLLNRLDRQLEAGFESLHGQLLFAKRSPANDCTGRLPEDGSALKASAGDTKREDNTRSTPAPGFSLPPGTYGAVVDDAGAVHAECIFGFRSSDEYAVPRFTLAQLSAEPSTISSGSGGDETEFRVATRDAAGGDHLVIALPLTDTRQALNRLLAVEVTVIALMLAVIGTAVWLLVGISLRQLDRMGETADAIAGSDLSRRIEPADPRSEIGRLGLALNRMLHRLERAFEERSQSEERLRRFLADASHELRTPLASIRGYAEIFRIGAADGEETSRSMERIEQEAKRMGVLVEDLLTLARLDETLGREHAPVDIGATARNAVDDAQAAAPDRKFTVIADDGLIVDGDRHELQQMLANLLHNARVHTPAGTPVEVTARRSGQVVRIDVRDHGQGLPPDAGGQLFERFWRTEGGRERGRAGSGLGLPIVAGIVAAHDGHVLAENALDGPGAIFSIWLPLRNPGAGAIEA